jgi:hypothetical protein
MIEDPTMSHILAYLAQTLTSQDKVKLIELTMIDAPLSQYPLEWQTFINDGLASNAN